MCCECGMGIQPDLYCRFLIGGWIGRDSPSCHTTAALLIAMAGLSSAGLFKYRRFRCEQYRDVTVSTAADLRSEKIITQDVTEIYGERQRKERAVELMSDLRAGDRVAIYQIRLNLLRDQSYWFGRDL